MKHRILPWIVFAVEAVSIVVIAFSAESGLPPAILLLYLLAPLAYAAVGALAASRRPDNRIGWIYLIPGAFFILPFLTLPIEWLVSQLASGPGTGGQELVGSLVWAGFIGTMLTLTWLYFPDGRLPSPRWRLVLWATIVGIPLTAITNVISNHPEILESIDAEVLGNIGGILLLAASLGSAASLIYRYRRGRESERQQIKWIASAAALTAFVTGLDFASGIWIRDSPLNLALANIFFPLSLLAVPVAAGIAILRYRLWDIDVIIRRTLVYGALTTMLVLVYLGLVTLFQTLFSAVSGQQATVAVVASTLAIAALFNPLRRRIQTVIDRSFYRRKYDAEQTMTAFARTASNEVDMDNLCQALIEVVEDTFQPVYASIWLDDQAEGDHPTKPRMTQSQE